MDERVDCKNCGKKSTPRLWHIKGGFFRRKRIQHICPYCGVVMYQTGGGVGFGLIGLGALLLLAVFSASNQSEKKSDINVQSLKMEIHDLEIRVNKYESEIKSLRQKTKNGNNPQLLPQLSGKPEKLKKLKKLLNEKVTLLESSKLQ